MNDEARLELEERIHALLCGALDEPQRRSLLLTVARDEAARRLLEEICVFQRDARAALICPADEEAMQSGLRRLLACLDAEDTAPAAAPPTRRRRRPRPVAGTWVWRLAASAALAAALVLAVAAYHAGSRTRDDLRRLDRRIAMAQMTASELATYRRVWREVAGPAGRPKPWVLLHDGGGRFEYLPGTEAEGAAGRFVVLRCALATDDGEVLERVNLLLPAGQVVRASLDEAGRLAGRTIRCRVDAEGERVGMDLELADGAAGTVGIRGGVRLGDRPTEIGRVKLNGRTLRVILDARAVSGGVS